MVLWVILASWLFSLMDKVDPRFRPAAIALMQPEQPVLSGLKSVSRYCISMTTSMSRQFETWTFFLFCFRSSSSTSQRWRNLRRSLSLVLVPLALWLLCMLLNEDMRLKFMSCDLVSDIDLNQLPDSRDNFWEIIFVLRISSWALFRRDLCRPIIILRGAFTDWSRPPGS